MARLPNTDITPQCSVTIYRDRTHYFTFNSAGHYGHYLTGAPVIHRAENQPGSATFTILNVGSDPTMDMPSVISEEFNRWAGGGKGAVTCGMYVLIRNNDHNAFTTVFTGIISDIQLNGDTITFTCADGNARLDKAGSDLRRNYRSLGSDGGGNGWFDAYVDPDRPEGENVYGLLNVAADDGSKVTVTSVGWTVPTDHTERIGTDWKPITMHNGFPHIFYVPVDFETGVWSFSVPFGTPQYGYHGSVTVKVDLMDADGRVYSASATGSNANPSTMQYHVSDSKPSGYWRGVLGVPVMIPDAITSSVISVKYSVVSYNSTSYFSNASPPTGSGIRTDYDSVVQWDELTMGIAGHWADVTVDGKVYQRFYPDLQSRFNAEPSSKRMYATYISVAVDVTDIVSNLCDAEGYGYSYRSDLPATTANLSLFRVGSGFIGDYLRKLCDVRTDDGRNRTFIATGMGPSVYVGTRYTAEDDPLFAIAYGGEDMSAHTVPASVLETFRFANFTPNKTLRHRANKVTYFATLNNESETISFPVTITDRLNGGNRAGRVIEAMSDGSVSSELEAVQGAWNRLTDNAIDQWEGTVTLPMSVEVRKYMSQFIGDGNEATLDMDATHTGSGVPVVIYDNRYGFDGLRAKVRQMEINYPECTVTLTLNNYSVQYSSDVSDSVAQTVKMGASNGAEESALWSKQYLSLIVTAENSEHCSLKPGDEMWVSGAEHANTVDFTDTEKIRPSSPTQWFKLPNSEDEWIVLARFDATTINQVDRKYGVTTVGFTEDDGDDHAVRIPAYKRPDFLVGQTLCVCLQVRGMS